MLEATTEQGLSKDSVTFADLFYQDSDDHITALGPPSLHESMYEPARPETSFGVLPADDNMSIVKTDRRGIGRNRETSIVERLCSESGARFNDQGWRQVGLSEYL